MQSWKRIYRLDFPEIGLSYDELKVMFDAQKDLTDQTNKASVQIFNLSEDSRKKIEKADLAAELYAGYRDGGGAAKIFTGTVIQAWSMDRGRDLVTELKISDGQIPIRDTMLSLSYPPGTGDETIIRRIAAEMGLPLVIGEGVTLKAHENGYSHVGQCGPALDEICEGSGCEWSIQNNILQVILEGGVVADRGLVFSPTSGLIGSPERIIRSNFREDDDNSRFRRMRRARRAKYEKMAGWRVRTLLAPTVQPGDAVKVESRMITGWFRVETVRHQGDSHGREWVTDMELIEGLSGDDDA